jgi:hypothetical protein
MREGPKVSGLTYKSRAKWKMRGVYSAICGEVNVSVSGSYVLQYAGGTRPSSWFISVILKSWSGRKLLDPTTYKTCVDSFTCMSIQVQWNLNTVLEKQKLRTHIICCSNGLYHGSWLNKSFMFKVRPRSLHCNDLITVFWVITGQEEVE